MNRIKRTIVYLFALVCVLVGIGGAFDAQKTWQQIKDWEEVACKITELKVHPARRGECRVAVQFTYQFKGETYIGDRLDHRFGEAKVSFFEKGDLEKQYAPGTNTVAYLDPEAPQQSHLKRVTLVDLMVGPAVALFLGLWVFYLLRKTRPRTVPKRVYSEAEDPDSRRWHAIYQDVIDLEMIKVEGSSWYAQSPGVSQWPKSRVGLIANPNTIVVVRGPFRLSGLAAVGLTLLAEFCISPYLAVPHFFFFAYEWWRRKKTWRAFRNASDISVLTAGRHSVEIVPIDNSLMHGMHDRTHEFWYRLPSRPVDDALKIPRGQRDQVERFMGFVRLMQQSRRILDEEANARLQHQQASEITFLT